MNHKKRIAIIIIAAALLAALLSIWLTRPSNTSTSGPEVIKGKVTSTSNECYVDGTCSVTLDDSKIIITGCGLTAHSETCKSYDQTQLHAGQQVEATVVRSESGQYNLECDTCTIRVIGE